MTNIARKKCFHWVDYVMHILIEEIRYLPACMTLEHNRVWDEFKYLGIHFLVHLHTKEKNE